MIRIITKHTLAIVISLCCIFSTLTCSTLDPIDPKDATNATGSTLPPPSSATQALSDSDNDTIADKHERHDNEIDNDKDNDGRSNETDDDSDGDGHLDRDEAGDSDLNTPPIDSDGDGIPDFLDTDSDDNGIGDAMELIGDLDGDGLLNAYDNDDDGDNLPDNQEIGDDGAIPLDSDDDGLADFQDTDSDNDTIGDIDEGLSDLDEDGIPSYLDLDSDNDCIKDHHEAGDDDLNTQPLDSDNDGQYNIQDIDSDNDGIADFDEDLNCNGKQNGQETSSTQSDSDSDGVSDLIEVVAKTDPLDSNDNPRAQGDFYFLIPYEQLTSPNRDVLPFSTNINKADIYLSFDTTGSMHGELDALRRQIPQIIQSLECHHTMIPCSNNTECAEQSCGDQPCVCLDQQCIENPVEGDGCIPSLWTGVGRWNDLNTYYNIQSLQADPQETANAIPYTGSGGSEAPIQPIICIAKPELCPNRFNKNCTTTGIGCPGFREDSIRILMQITDANNQCSGSECNNFTINTAGQVLQEKQIEFIALVSNEDSSGTPSTEQLARQIGIAAESVDQSGEPFVYQALDDMVIDQTSSAILKLSRELNLTITTEISNVSSNGQDPFQFLSRLVINTTGENCANVDVQDTNNDGIDDTILSLRAGTQICWDLIPVPTNITTPSTTEPQVFQMHISVLGNGSPLSSHNVFFLIPPHISQSGIN